MRLARPAASELPGLCSTFGVHGPKKSAHLFLDPAALTFGSSAQPSSRLQNSQVLSNAIKRNVNSFAALTAVRLPRRLLGYYLRGEVHLPSLETTGDENREVDISADGERSSSQLPPPGGLARLGACGGTRLGTRPDDRGLRLQDPGRTAPSRPVCWNGSLSPGRDRGMAGLQDSSVQPPRAVFPATVQD